ncbi:hypothetical protein [Roseobacter sp. MH60115]|uniref:hypothetical protein n=1 Tax=Roseobacter sp. MH60115 TaxID=2785324 RepID=UPI0018A2DD1B|nr:hypothetical protein [Roseobacter sp. MH60115]
MILKNTNALSENYGKCTWTNSAGRQFVFSEYPIDYKPEGDRDIYLFCACGIFGYSPIYIGKATDLNSRLSGHERRDEAKRYGATTLLVYSPGGLLSELFEDNEKQLIQEFRPLLNTQHAMGGVFGTNALEHY